MTDSRPRRPSRPEGRRPPRPKSGPSRPPEEDPARMAALDALRAVRERDAYANLVLPAALRRRSVRGRDAALATELTYGTCRASGLLDAIIAECSNRDLSDVDPFVLDALRLGVYQLIRT